MHTKKITVTLQNDGRGQEQEVDVPVLSIMSVNELWEWVQQRNPDGTLGRKSHVYFGTHIAAKAHYGWLVKERVPRVEQLIHTASRHNKHFNYECGPECCNRIFSEERKKRSA